MTKHEEYLAHYRTPGSKNGVRQYQTEDGTWTSEGLARRRAQYSSKIGAFNKKWNEMSYKDQATTMEKFTKGITSTTSSFDELTNALNDPKKRKAIQPYYDMSKQLTDDQLREYANRINLEQNYVNARIKDHRPANFNKGDVINIIKKSMGVAGALAAIYATYSGVLSYNKKNNSSAEHSDLTVYDNCLRHYGVSGQKWGVRRWQNEDGSLTPEGYEHYYGDVPYRYMHAKSGRVDADVRKAKREARKQYREDLDIAKTEIENSRASDKTKNYRYKIAKASLRSDYKEKITDINASKEAYYDDLSKSVSEKGYNKKAFKGVLASVGAKALSSVLSSTAKKNNSVIMSSIADILDKGGTVGLAASGVYKVYNDRQAKKVYRSMA